MDSFINHDGIHPLPQDPPTSQDTLALENTPVPPAQDALTSQDAPASQDALVFESGSDAQAPSVSQAIDTIAATEPEKDTQAILDAIKEGTSLSLLHMVTAVVDHITRTCSTCELCRREVHPPS